MSKIFKNTLKTFKSDITGEEKEYKVNNALWLFMDSLFDLNQEKFDEELTKNVTAAQTKFTTAVLKANGLDVTYEEVMKNTDPETVMEFYNSFFDTAFLQKDQAEKEAKKKV